MTTSVVVVLPAAELSASPARSDGPSPRYEGNNVGSVEARRLAWRALVWLQAPQFNPGQTLGKDKMDPSCARTELRSVAACRRSFVAARADLVLSQRNCAQWQALRTCGSVWACPVCARKVWAGRAEQLTAALTRWAERDGHAALVTLTMRHEDADELPTLWDALSGAWRATEQSRGVRTVRDKLGLAGFVRRVEATCGPPKRFGGNGWHLHVHAVAFFERAPAAADLDRLGDVLYRAWSAHLTRKGFAAPLRGPGVDVKLLDLTNPAAAVSGYITQRSTPEGMAARELTDAMGGKRAKGGNRTPWELLTDAMDGDRYARKRWHEWERASKGKRALTWGPIKRLLDLDDSTDEELAEREDLEAALIAQLTREEWDAVRAVPDGPADLLTVAERAARGQGQDRMSAVHAAIGDVALTLEAWGIRAVRTEVRRT